MRVEIEGAIEEIKRKGARKVGLQLPDGLRRRSFEIAEEIERRTGAEVIISGNTCFGACDLDLHLLGEVELIIHIGHTPIPIGEHENVIFVPAVHDFEVRPLLSEALPLLGEKVCLTTTAQHLQVLEEARIILEESGKEVILKKPKRSSNPGQVLGCDFSAVEKNADILFIGSGDFHPLGISFFARKQIIVLDPLKNEVRVVDAEGMRKRRYLIVSRCFEAEKFGILVSTKPFQKRISLARELREKAREKGVRAEIILFDTILWDALMNFDADVYVNTACPRITYDDVELHPKPMITPEEFLVVLGEKKLEDITMDQMINC